MPALLHSPADILRYTLIALGAGVLPVPNLTDDWQIYVNREPDIPDNCITVYDTSGILHGRTHWDGEILEHYGVQVRIRGNSPLETYAKANAIMILMDETLYEETVTVGSSSYLVHNVSRKGGLLSLGTEAQTSRNLYTLNAVVSLETA